MTSYILLVQKQIKFAYIKFGFLYSCVSSIIYQRGEPLFFPFRFCFSTFFEKNIKNIEILSEEMKRIKTKKKPKPKIPKRSLGKYVFRIFFLRF